jgi:hypothetical protein
MRNSATAEVFAIELRYRGLGFALIGISTKPKPRDRPVSRSIRSLGRRNFPEGSEGIAKLALAHAITTDFRRRYSSPTFSRRRAHH